MPDRHRCIPDPHTGPPYPGLGLPLHAELNYRQSSYPIGAHGSCSGSQTDVLPVREVAMLSIMDRLTDKEEWHKKVFDDEIVGKWREEAMAIPDKEFWRMSRGAKYRDDEGWLDEGESEDEGDGDEDDDDAYWRRRNRWRFRCQLEGIVNDGTFDCIIKELRSKATHFEKTGIVPTMDACASVAKSDCLVSPDLHKDLRDAFSKLIADQSDAPDWHPKSNDMVLDLVHPSMYPLIYGRSKVFSEEIVGIDDAIHKWSGKGDVIAKDNWTWDEDRDKWSYGVGGSIHPDYWNNTYQWLPSNLAFQDDGTVRFTSYVNNLHPQTYMGIYRTIEKLIHTAIPAWEQCLKLDFYRRDDDWEGGAGRTSSRFDYPDNADDDIPENWIPSDMKEVANIEVNWDEVGPGFSAHGSYSDDKKNDLNRKWELLRKARIPEAEFEDVDYMPKEGERLFDKFRDTGLQIIVKMVSIELTPEKPDFAAGNWHVEGQMNEHICATALYYLDSENVTPSTLSFRMQTDAYLQQDYSVGQEAYSWLEQIWGTELGDSAVCLQNYGKVETKQGRLLAFPNVFQHRVSPFSLVDKTKPGHRRFIALWLVDPHQRIISTANVPPQQQDWWFDSVVGGTAASRDAATAQLPPEIVALLQKSSLSDAKDKSEEAKEGAQELREGKEGKLPPELMDMVWQHFAKSKEEGLLSVEEAKAHRLKLMEARTAYVEKSEDMWHNHTYNFCEH